MIMPFLDLSAIGNMWTFVNTLHQKGRQLRPSEVRPLIDLFLTGVRLPSASDSLTRALIGAITPTAPPDTVTRHGKDRSEDFWRNINAFGLDNPVCNVNIVNCSVKTIKKTDCLNMFELFDTNWSVHGLGGFLAVNKAPVLISAAPILGLACGGLSPSERKQQLHF